MSQYGNTRPIEGLVRRGMNQPIPDLTQPPPVAVPGLDVLAPAPSGLAGQVANVFEGAVGLTMAGARFAAMTRERDAQELQANLEQQRRDSEAFRKAEEAGSKVIQGEALQAWTVDKEIVLGQLGRGELSPPTDMKEETLRGWAKSVVDTRTSGREGIYADTYAAAATNELIAAVQQKAASVLAKDREVMSESLASAAAEAKSPADLQAAFTQGASLGIDQRTILMPAATFAARSGNDNYPTVFRPLLEKPEFALQRQMMDLAFEQAQDQKRQATLREQAQREQSVELADRKSLRSFEDNIYAELSSVASDPAKKEETVRRWESVVNNTAARNENWATELQPLANRLAGMREGFDQQRLVEQVNQSHSTQLQAMVDRDVSAYLSGNAIEIPDSGVKTRVQLPDGTVSERDVAGYRKSIQETAVRYAPTLAEQVRILENDTIKYEPWQKMLAVGASAADSAKFQTGDTKAETAISPNTVKGVQLYTSIAAFNQTLADKYAGENADFYRDVSKQMRVAGVGSNINEAVQQVVLQRQNASGKALGLMDNEYKSIASDYDTRNSGEVAMFVNMESERQQRMLGKNKADAVDSAKEIAKGQFVTINGFSTRTYNTQLPPGVYGSTDKTFSAVVGDIARRNNVESKDLAVRINPQDGTVLLWDFKTGLPSTSVPINDRVFTIDEVYKRANKIRLEEVKKSPFGDLGKGIRLEGLAL